MTSPSGTRSKQRGAVLLGLAGGMLLVASGFGAAYYVLGNKAEARAAALPPAGAPTKPDVQAPAPTAAATSGWSGYVAREVEVKTAGAAAHLHWSDLGIEVDPNEVGRVSGDATALGAKGSIPVRLDRERAVKALLELKAKSDTSPVNAYLDLEEHAIHDDVNGSGIDVFASLPRLETAAREGAASVELVKISVPARVTKATLGIDDVSHVMGHYTTKFPVTDRDRNFNLKLAASKINGSVIKPHEEWSFNGTVGERSEKEGYKIAHVINAGEMVDGLAGGTCQISTTLFGASFFAGIEIVKTTNHSRPSAYTPLGFDATVVWPDTDLKLKNPYDFPVAIAYRVANGEAVVEILGKERPFDKIVFERHILERTPFTSEERPDDEMPEGTQSLDQAGFDGIKLERFRRFYKDKKLVKSDKWTVTYKPVTEYVRVGHNKDPEAKAPPEKEVHRLPDPKDDSFAMAQ